MKFRHVLFATVASAVLLGQAACPAGLEDRGALPPHRLAGAPGQRKPPRGARGRGHDQRARRRRRQQDRAGGGRRVHAGQGAVGSRAPVVAGEPQGHHGHLLQRPVLRGQPGGRTPRRHLLGNRRHLGRPHQARLQELFPGGVHRIAERPAGRVRGAGDHREETEQATQGHHRHGGPRGLRLRHLGRLGSRSARQGTGFQGRGNGALQGLDHRPLRAGAAHEGRGAQCGHRLFLRQRRPAAAAPDEAARRQRRGLHRHRRHLRPAQLRRRARHRRQRHLRHRRVGQHQHRGAVAGVGQTAGGIQEALPDCLRPGTLVCGHPGLRRHLPAARQRAAQGRGAGPRQGSRGCRGSRRAQWRHRTRMGRQVCRRIRSRCAGRTCARSRSPSSGRAASWWSSPRTTSRPRTRSWFRCPPGTSARHPDPLTGEALCWRSFRNCWSRAS